MHVQNYKIKWFRPIIIVLESKFADKINQTVTVLTNTRIGIPEVLARILKVQWLTLLTLAADSVV